jgi:hypothetical protein
MRPYLGKTYHKKRVGGVAQDVGPEIKPQYHKKKKKTGGVAQVVQPLTSNHEAEFKPQCCKTKTEICTINMH